MATMLNGISMHQWESRLEAQQKTIGITLAA